MARTRGWAVVVPMANEEQEFAPFLAALTEVLEGHGGGTVYFVVDRASRDRTLELCREVSERDPRFRTVWAPENRNVVDAYLRGFQEAFDAGHDPVIEMDAGLSHDPAALPAFLRALAEGNDCAFGSRYINGGSMTDSPLSRRFLSKGGSWLARLLLGARLRDMTSGYEGFRRQALGELLQFRLRSKGHFYQTEVRYLLRHHRSIEIPIHYRSPSPRVSPRSLRNALETLGHYTWRRLTGRAPSVSARDSTPGLRPGPPSA